MIFPSAQQPLAPFGAAPRSHAVPASPARRPSGTAAWTLAPAVVGFAGALAPKPLARRRAREAAAHCRPRRGLQSSSIPRPASSSETGGPRTPAELAEERRQGRWAELRDELDWTRYHLQVLVVERGGSGRARIAAGLFERVAQFHSCAGALPVEAATAGGGPCLALPGDLAEELNVAGHWVQRDVDDVSADTLNWYDVVVCVDGGARGALGAMLQGVGGGGALPPHVVDLGDFGPYLELRKAESPMKAWVPDWREEFDPGYEVRVAAAPAPRDDALAVWRSLPEDLAQRIHPKYAEVARTVTASDMSGEDGTFGGDDDVATLAFHAAGLVRFLMDSYPLDLHGGPGYVPL